MRSCTLDETSHRNSDFTIFFRHHIPQMDPFQLENKTRMEWMKMSFEECVLGDDRECSPKSGDIVDNQIVYEFRLKFYVYI